MKKNLCAIAVIGGSGLYDMEEFRDKKEIKIKTPFGSPSDSIITGKISGTACAFLPRHGRGHRLLPCEIPQKANIYALKSMGVKTIISVSAVGSLKEEFAPTHFVFPDQLVDETKNRECSFFGKGVVAHFPMAHPFCGNVQKMMHEQAEQMRITAHFGGVYVCMEGPSFSTRAESEFHRKMGYSIIGMTVAAEAKLAREAGICYAPVSLVTDYDCWKEGEEVDQESVLKTLRQNVANIKKLLARAIPLVEEIDAECECAGHIKTSVLTARENIPAGIYRKLRLILDEAYEKAKIS
ncbi:MAG: S-methyl-5'-thioadenosine phosphorylase [Elusimicrobia bacterium]|nr:S-methyl-5'-thioadenosine phosphorylase [Elusimicrobiota bacterium]